MSDNCDMCHGFGEVILTHNPTTWIDCPHIHERTAA